jgi:homocysteine S-methyltransferase
MSYLTPIDPFINKQGIVILDGGLATELEKMGFDLNTHLWSAHLLDSNPEAIKKVHRSYLEAGADCIISSSYQASIPGFIKKGFSEKKARSLLKRSITLATEACDEHFRLSKDSKNKRIHPVVAASIGPYGAYLANGAEYRGKYNIPKSQLKSFHESRWEVIRDSDINLFACETIPGFDEAEVLLDILKQTPEIFAWISFSCQDGERISDGTRIQDCATLFKDCDQVVAIGINCTAPKFISSLIAQVRSGAPEKPVVVYPNAGNIYDIKTRSWLENSDPLNYGIAACDWYKSGARLIGGCCQIGPEHISVIKTTLIKQGLYRILGT